MKEQNKDGEKNMFDIGNMPAIVMLPFLYTFGGSIADFVLNNTNVQNLMKSDEKFDVVLVTAFCIDSLAGFGQFYKAPVVAISTFGASKWTDDFAGAPPSLSYVPNAFLDYTDRMSFYQRFNNALLNIFENVVMYLYHYPKQAKIYNKYFPDPKPDFNEVLKSSVSLVLLNTHFSYDYPRPYLPNIKEIGGIQIDRNIKPLPADIQEFIDSAEHGVIFFSMGSNLKSVDFPEAKREAFVKVFSKLKQKVIWKFESESFSTKPKNVLISDWLPQNDILAHPKVKLFITHGGLLGTTEAIYHGIPIVGIPIYGDQRMNVARAEKAGYGVKLEYSDLDEEHISAAINEVLSKPKYIESIKKISIAYRDQPMTPKETANYWVDYVGRHKGAAHMQAASRELNYFQHSMIDVAIVLVILSVIGFLLFCLVVKVVLKKVFLSKKCDKKDKKNK